jgi:O-antigen/teichoic acid export membrane protein
MGIVVKQSIRNSIFLFSGVILGAINVLYLFPKFLGTEVFGITKILADIAILGGSIATFGLPMLFIKYMPNYRSNNKKQPGLLNFVLIASLIGFIIIASVIFLLKPVIMDSYGNKDALFNKYFLLSIPIMLFVILNAAFSEYCKSILKSVFATFVTEFLLRLIITVLLLLAGFGVIGIDLFLYGYVLVYFIGTIAFIIYLKLQNELILGPFKPLRGIKKRALIFFRYGFANFLTNISAKLATRLDGIMILALLPTITLFDSPSQAVGIYGFGLYVSSLVTIPGRGLVSIAAPLVGQAWKNNDLPTISDLYRKTALNQLIFGGFVFVGICLCIDDLIRIVPEYELGKWIVIWIGIGKLCVISFGVNIEIIVTSKHYFVATIASFFLAILLVLGNYILIPIYEIEGAAIATCVGVTLVNVFAAIYLWLKYKIQPFTMRTLLAIGLIVGSFYTINTIPVFSNAFFDAVLRGGILTVLYFGAVLSLKLSPEINNLFSMVLNKIGLKK